MPIFSISGLAHGVPIFIKALSILCRRYAKARVSIVSVLTATPGVPGGAAVVSALDTLATACPAIEALDAFL